MKTVAELRIYLEKNNLSPEDVAPKVNISNMTIRRLLAKSGQTKIPNKYTIQLEKLKFPDLSQVTNVIDYLEEAGHQTQDDLKKIQSDFDEKLDSAPVDLNFKEKLKVLAKTAFSGENRKLQAIALGALIYFINPLDLVPDYLPMGYIDDLGVVTMALGAILKK